MRGSHKPQFLHRDDGALLGINLGADFCAEHEWGIAELKRMLGVGEKGKFGVDSRLVTKLPEKDIYWEETKSHAILVVVHLWNKDEIKKISDVEYVKRELKPYKRFNSPKNEPLPLSAAWDSKSFGIWASSTGDREKLRQIHKALMAKELLVGFGLTNNPFENPGLTLVRLSALPEEARQAMYDKDADHQKLLDTAQATGIHDILKNANKGYFALSPRWDESTPEKIIFWLNPTEQNSNNSGWFTLADLKAWVENKGPIPKERGKV